jgi:hypothetical protein
MVGRLRYEKQRGSTSRASGGQMRNFAGGHARNQYGIDPELNHAWDNRHESPDAIRRCQRCVRHAVGKLRNEAKLESEHIRVLA